MATCKWLGSKSALHATPGGSGHYKFSLYQRYQQKQQARLEQQDEDRLSQKQEQQEQQHTQQLKQQSQHKVQQIQQLKQQLKQQQPRSSSEIKSPPFTPEIGNPPKSQVKTVPPPPPRFYRCEHPGCRSSFARYHDLKRHMSIHSPPPMLFDCPYASSGTCGRAGEKTATSKGGFVREDDYMAHIREVHGEDIPER